MLHGFPDEPDSSRSGYYFDFSLMAFGPDPSFGVSGRFRKRDDRVKYLCEKIGEQSTHSDFSLDQVALLVDMSRRRIQRDLKSAGTSFAQILREKRLRRFVTAAANVRTGRIAIRLSEIAYNSGFGDLSHFNREVRERYGVVPSGYLAAGR